MNQKKTKTLSSLSFIAAIVVAAIGVVMFVLGILYFIAAYQYYSTQAATFIELIKYLYESAAFRSLFEPLFAPIALYGGLSIVLFCVSYKLKLTLVDEAPVSEIEEAVDENYVPEFSFDETEPEADEATEETDDVSEDKNV